MTPKARRKLIQQMAQLDSDIIRSHTTFDAFQSALRGYKRLANKEVSSFLMVQSTTILEGECRRHRAIAAQYEQAMKELEQGQSPPNHP